MLKKVIDVFVRGAKALLLAPIDLPLSATVLVCTTIFLASAPFLEGTSTGWHSRHMHKLSFAEQTHEPRMVTVDAVAYIAVCTVVATLQENSNVGMFLGGYASIILWAVMLTRLASATHASDNITSTIVVPWHSFASAIGVSVAKPCFKLVRRFRN